MKTIMRGALGLLVGLSLGLSVAAPTSAQELPTGAARIVEKVQTRIFISKSTLLNNIAQIQANVAEKAP